MQRKKHSAEFKAKIALLRVEKPQNNQRNS
jgi:hypothetical protein